MDMNHPNFDLTPAALTIEGGSLRCMFSAAVTDVLLENHIHFAYVNGVSSGSMTAMNYVSRQNGRMLLTTKTYLHDKRYMGLRHIIKKRMIFNFDFSFGEMSSTLIPFDYDAFYSSPQRYEAVATRCKTGQPEYFEKGVCPDIINAIKASSSIPVLSRMIKVDHRQYLDGGISMPIAYKRPMDLGYGKVVLILTRDLTYRKKPMSPMMERAYRHYFAPLPHLLDSLMEIPDRYNRMVEEIVRLESEGKIFVIRPEHPVTVSRMEQNIV